MKTRKLVLGSVLAASALSLLATGVVNARPYGDCDARFGGRYATLERHGLQPAGSPHHLPHHLMKRLDLTEEQRDQMFEITHAQQPAIRKKMKALHKGREALQQAAMAETYDSEAVRALADRQAEIKAELIVMRNATFHSIFTLLTSEQREEITQMKEKGGAGFHRP